MITEVQIEECEVPFCVIHAKEKTTGIENIAERILSMDENGRMVSLKGWDGDYCQIIKPEEIYRIYSQDKKVFVEVEGGVFLLKMRLYEVEDFLAKNGFTYFIRISNTDIVNFTNVLRLDLSLTGIIKVILKNNNVVLVSRRYMGTIRKELCLKK